MSLYIIIPVLISYFLFSYFFEFYRIKIGKKQLKEINCFLENWELRFIENLYVEIDDFRITRQYSTAFKNLKTATLNKYRKQLLIGKPTIFKTDFFESNTIDTELFSKTKKVFNTNNDLEKTKFLLPKMILFGEEQLSKLIKPEIVEISRKEYDENQEECKRLRKKVIKKLRKEFYPRNGDSIRKLIRYKPKWLTDNELIQYTELLFDIKEQLKLHNPVILEKEISEFFKKLNNKYFSYFEKDRKLKEYLAEQELADAYEKVIYRFISLKSNLNEISEKEELKALTKRINTLKDDFSREDLENWKRNNEFQKTFYQHSKKTIPKPVSN